MRIHSENIFNGYPSIIGLSVVLVVSNLLAVTPVNFARGAFGILNCGSQEGLTQLPDAYFDYLQRMNMQWVDIGVTLQVDNSVDSTVERFYSTDYVNYVPTFPDASIIKMVQQLHAHG